MKKKVLFKCLDIAKDNNTLALHPEFECNSHFSFIIQQNTIIDWGTNRKSSPLTFLGYEPYTKMHSEVDAFFKAKGIMEKDRNFEVVNVRLNRQNMIRLSAPCRCCFSFLNKLGCRGVWFTTNTESFAHILFDRGIRI